MHAVGASGDGLNISSFALVPDILSQRVVKPHSLVLVYNNPVKTSR